jgi:hypothetical protein
MLQMEKRWRILLSEDGARVVVMVLLLWLLASLNHGSHPLLLLLLVNLMLTMLEGSSLLHLGIPTSKLSNN